MPSPSSLRNFPIARWCVIAILALQVPLGADDALPAKPPGMLLDDARLFTSEQVAQLNALQRECEVQTGVRVYLAAFTLLQRPDIVQQTRDLVRPWLGDEAAIILTFHRGSRQSTVALAPELWRRYPTSDLVSAFDNAAKLLTDKSERDDAKRMIGGVKEVTKRLERMEKQRQARLRLFTRRDALLAAALSGVLLVMGVIAWWALRRMRSTDRERSVQFEFPQVEVATRLGAPLGGGVIGEASVGP